MQTGSEGLTCGLKITFVTRGYWPALGGQENYLRHLATGLAETHDVTVLAQTNSSVTGINGRLAGLVQHYPEFSPYSDGDVTVRQLRIPEASRRWLRPAALTDVRPFSRYAYTKPARMAVAALYDRAVHGTLRGHLVGADVVHMWGGDVLGASTLSAARSVGAHTVITPFAHPGQHGDDPFSSATYSKADRVIGLLDCDAALYRRMGVPAERIRVVPVCSPGTAARPVNTGPVPTGPIVLFFAVRRAYKGLDVLLAALQTLAERVPATTLVVAGPGDPIVGAYPLPVVDLGKINDELASAWLTAADVLCLPSSHEIFPVSFLEAWSAGTAVVASDIEPLVELVDRSGGGVTVKRDPVALGSLLADLLLEEGRAAALGSAGRAWWSEHATPARIVSAQETVYRELLLGTKRR